MEEEDGGSGGDVNSGRMDPVNYLIRLSAGEWCASKLKWRWCGREVGLQGGVRLVVTYF